MKNIIYLLLLIPQLFFAQSGFKQGNELYQNAKYAEAIKAYESELSNNLESAELYFNLGNCYYKQHQIAAAIYNYEKALLLDPNKKEAANNIKFAQKQTIDEIKVVPKVGFNKLLRDFTGIYPFDTWAWISIGFSFLFLLFFIGYYFNQSVLLKRIFFVGMFLQLLLLMLSVSSAIFEKSHFDNERPAIVFADAADVRSEPQNASSTTFVLHPGTKVYVDEKLGNWRKIELTDGSEGWINSQAIKEIKD